MSWLVYTSLATLAIFIVIGETVAANVSQKVDTETAQRLAAEAYNWPERYIWYDRRDRSFFVVAPLGGEYEAPVTWLAINPWTGDVWNVWQCKRLSTATLRKSLAAIRRRFRRNELPQYARLHALRPVCYGP
jgi:hypothetical protein